MSTDSSSSQSPFFSLSMLKHPMFKQGAKDILQIGPGSAAWSIVTSVAMVKAGIPPTLAFLMSLMVYAGSAQLAALPLMAANASIWVVLLTGFCINLRFAIFSLQWRDLFLQFNWWQRLSGGYLCGDTVYVLFMKRYLGAKPSSEQMPYFWGLALINWVLWQTSALIGIILSDFVPQSWGLQFAAVLALAVLIFSMLNGWMTWLAMIVTAIVVVLTEHFFPYHLNIVVGIMAAVAAALVAEKMSYTWRSNHGSGKQLQSKTVSVKNTEHQQED